MNEKNTEIILVRLDMMEGRQNERHTDLVKRLDKLERRVENSEEWRHQQIGRGKVVNVGTSAIVSAGIATLWNLITGRA